MDTPIYAFNRDIRPIEQIVFDVLGNEEIKGRSVLGRNTHGVEFPDLYENNEPKINGLADPRLGTVDNNSICATCGYNNNYCPGHSGHMDLVEPFFHIGFKDHIKKILDCICLKCSRVLINKNENKVQDIIKTKIGKARLLEVSALSKNITYCGHCGTHVSKIKIEIKKSTATINFIAETDLENIKDDELILDGKKKIKQNLTPEIIYEKLKNISDDDCRIIGIEPERTRPENMIHKTFLIPPIAIRPSAKGDFNAGSVMEDGLTHRLVDITKFNYKLMKQKEIGTSNISKYSKEQSTLLQYHIAAYFDKTLISSQKNDGDKYRSLAPGIKSKEGRIRANLMGKRCDFTARTVITSDPVIDNNQVRVPVKIAMSITFPEVVTPSNIDYLRELVRKGRDTYPGANFVFPVSNMTSGQTIWPIDLRFRKEQVELHYGDIVERHLKTGDIVLLNRQPTLHKQSMMGHRIKVINDPTLMTFGLSVAVTKPYNADFDGDEMNIFVPQSIQTQIELEEIADVKRQIISPSSSRTSIGLVQDGIIGSYLLTAPTTSIDWRNVMNILSYTTFDKMDKIEKNKNYTGNEVFTHIIPKGINIMGSGIKVKDSVLLEGSRLSKSVLGEKNNFALHQFIWDEYGPDETKKFIDNAQKLANNFNLYNGFTIGYGDTAIDKSIKENIDKYYITKQLKIEHMITELENSPDMMEKDVFEYKLLNEMSIVLDDVSKIIINNFDANNNFNIIVSSGAKGSSKNVGQMCGSLSLLQIEGKLAAKKYNSRTLPYFHQHDDRSASRGLVKESFLEGLSFPSFTFMLMASREGVCDGALKTADSGYMQRKLVKTLEDVMVKYDYTVRSANETLLQLVYGDSGSDTTKQYQYDITIGNMSDEQLKEAHYFTSDELSKFKNFNKNDEVFNKIKYMRDEFRTCMIRAKCDFKAITTKVWFPVNFTRIIDSISTNKELMKGDIVEPNYVYEKIETILSNEYLTLMAMNKDDRENENSLKNRDEKRFKTFIKIALYNGLSPKKCCVQRKLTKLQFDTIIDKIITTYNKSIVQPGEMTGVLSAQSMGEPLTQMTLNTFHTSGIKTISSTTIGIPRLREILSYSKNIKTPQMIVSLLPEFNKNKDMAHKIASNLKNTLLGDVRGRINIYYDIEPDSDDSFMKNDNVKNVYYSSKSTKNSCSSNYKDLPWLMRIEILKEKMLEKEISLLDIKSKFCNWWEKRYIDNKLLRKEEKRVLNKITSLAVLSNTDNDEQPVIHIRFNVKDVDKVKDPFNREMLNEFIDEIIDKFKLKGLDAVSGIPDIPVERNMVIDDKTNEIKFENQYMIYTIGTNLIDIRYIIGIDILNTISNDIYDVYKTFGIEIARARLLRELETAYSGGGSTVSYTNLSILVDIMTNGGNIMSIDRHGLNKSEIDVLGRASFESTVEQILTAGLFGEIDNMKGVSSRIIGGLVVKGGTGFCDIVLDTNLIEKSEYSGENKYTTYNEINTDKLAKDVITNDVGDMFIPM